MGGGWQEGPREGFLGDSRHGLAPDGENARLTRKQGACCTILMGNGNQLGFQVTIGACAYKGEGVLWSSCSSPLQAL